MTSEPRHRLDLWAMCDVYRSTVEIVLEANRQLPFAVLDAWLRLART